MLRPSTASPPGIQVLCPDRQWQVWLIFALWILREPVASQVKAKIRIAPYPQGCALKGVITDYITAHLCHADSYHCIWCVPSRAIISYRGKLDSKGSHLGLFCFVFLLYQLRTRRGSVWNKPCMAWVSDLLPWPWDLGLDIPSPCGLNFATNADIARKLEGAAEPKTWDSCRRSALRRAASLSCALGTASGCFGFVCVYSKRRGWNLE